MTRLRFILDWEINCQFAGLVWARANGLYEDAGLDVCLVPPSKRSLSPVLDAVREAPLSAGCMEDNLIVHACARGAGIRAIGAMFQTTPMVLMTAAENEARTLSDLSGLRIGVHEDGIHLLETVLSLHGVDLTSMDIVVKGWTLDDLIRGRLDAAQGYAITEPAGLEAAGFRPRLIPVAHTHLHPYAQMMFATNECIREHAEPLSRFLRATFAGWREALADPARAARHVAAVSDEQPDADRNTRIIEGMHPIVVGAMSPERLGTMERERWQRNLSTYEAYGMVSRAPRLDQVMDERLLARSVSDRQGPEQ